MGRRLKSYFLAVLMVISGLQIPAVGIGNYVLAQTSTARSGDTAGSTLHNNDRQWIFCEIPAGAFSGGVCKD